MASRFRAGMIGLGLLAGMPTAQALVLDARSQLTVGGVTKVVTDADPVSVNAFRNSNDLSGDGYAFAFGIGDDSGKLRAAAGGGYIFAAEGYVRQSVDFTNTTGSAQNYYFDFSITAGTARAYNTVLWQNAAEYIQASSLASIKLNGVDVFTTGVSVRNTRDGISFSQTGSALNGYTQLADGYTWGAFSDRLDLGVFAAGESFTLSYDILTAVSGNIPSVECGARPTIDEATGLMVGGDTMVRSFGGYLTTCRRNYAEVRFGDPNSLTASPISVATVTTGMPTTTVPEPGTFLLMGGGVLAFGLARRRRGR